MLQVDGVTKRFGGIAALDSVSVSFRPGRVTGLIGPNGAGKTTLFNIINGFLRPDAGEVRLADRRIDRLEPFQVARLGVGRMFQDTRVLAKLSVLENVMLAARAQPGENPLRVFFTPGTARAREAKIRAEAERCVDYVGLGAFGRCCAEALSYGQQKLLTLARLLAGQSDVLLLDEPTAGVDPGFVPTILKLLRELAQGGKTVVIIEHNMTTVLQACDWVFFMDEGRITSFGLPSEVLDDPSVRSAYLGL
jgi:ABC-type branched-subunit amino acid transport system ATPase component